MKKAIVNFSQNQIKGGEVYAACSWYHNSNSSLVPNYIYFMSKPRY